MGAALVVVIGGLVVVVVASVVEGAAVVVGAGVELVEVTVEELAGELEGEASLSPPQAASSMIRPTEYARRDFKGCLLVELATC